MLQLKVKRGGRLVSICADSINLPPLEELDGVVFAFITRRGTIMPFAQRLSPEQGVMAYLWGESTHSFATVAAKAGDSVRPVGSRDSVFGAQADAVVTQPDVGVRVEAGNGRWPDLGVVESGEGGSLAHINPVSTERAQPPCTSSS